MYNSFTGFIMDLLGGAPAWVYLLLMFLISCLAVSIDPTKSSWWYGYENGIKDVWLYKKLQEKLRKGFGKR